VHSSVIADTLASPPFHCPFHVESGRSSRTRLHLVVVLGSLESLVIQTYALFVAFSLKRAQNVLAGRAVIVIGDLGGINLGYELT